MLKNKGNINAEEIIAQHLLRFKHATRGRRGTNPAAIPSENEWWALGQHQFLATSLLDWSTSPFVASFFAYEFKEPSSTGSRMVFGISRTSIESEFRKIVSEYRRKGRPPIIEFVDPFSDENPRLVNQGGLFTRSPFGVDIEKWIMDNLTVADKRVRMWKLRLPELEREVALKSVNRMNINHLSLFPDLYGASLYSNLSLEIDNYLILKHAK